jgi:hypothetical protein
MKRPLSRAVLPAMIGKQLACCAVGRKQSPWRHARLKRRRQRRVDRTGMEREAAGVGIASRQFDGEGFHELVLRRLRCAIGIPATAAIVSDGSDPGRQRREHRRLTTTKEGHQRPGQ